MARVGLVLGAGGVAGGAWHAGTLASLTAATGWDPRSSEVVVGTSAGSITGAMLRAGMPVGDLFASARGEPLSAEGSRLVGRMDSAAPAFTLDGRGRPRLAAPANPALLRALLPWDRRPGVALAGLLPAGAIDASAIGARVQEAAGGPGWPARSLWIVAVRLSDGRRVVFGRDEVVALGDAVSASAAIPGLFAPIEIGGERYVDGGVHATTNADLVAGLDLDLVVVSAPMAGRWRGMRANPATLARTGARVSLDREVAKVRRSGTPVLVLQPGPADTPLMDGRSMDPAARRPIAEQTFRSVSETLGRAAAAELVALLPRLKVKVKVKVKGATKATRSAATAAAPPPLTAGDARV